MRWELLFADLEGQWEAEAALELAGEVADRTRREVARLRLVDRLRAGVGGPLELQLAASARERGSLRAVGPDWLLLDSVSGAEVLVPLGAVLVARGLGRHSAQPGAEGALAARLDLRHALRGLARDRARVSVLLADGNVLSGRVERVGADFLEVREPEAATDPAVLPLTAVVLVRHRQG